MPEKSGKNQSFVWKCRIKLEARKTITTSFQSFKLGCAVGAVPSIPGKLAFALLDSNLCAHLHALCVGEIVLQKRQ